ncbi:MAG: FAD-binding oxidoreductase [Microvirga sp.]
MFVTDPDTYYSRTSPRAPGNRLDGSFEADVCIVGGGLAGLTAALELVRGGLSVVLLEARRIAWGASGRNGGFVSAGYATSLSSIARRVGPQRAAELFRLSMEGVDIVRNNIASLGIAEADPVPGIFKALRYESRGALQRMADAGQRDFGLDLVHVPGRALRDILHSPRYREALFDAGAFHFHPVHYAQGLAREAARLGAVIGEGEPVLRVALEGTRKSVWTQSAQVAATHVLFATGGYTGGLLPALQRAYLPIATYVLLTEAAPDLIRDAIRTRAAILDDRRAGDYYRLVEGGSRILWGGRITTRTTDPRDLAARLHREMIGTYPQLAGLRVELAWSGLMSYARHLMPQIGRASPGIWYATAFGGHGMNTTALAGRLVAEGIAGTSERYALFAPFDLAWNGGFMGKAAAQLTYWGYQVADRIREGRRE